MIDAAQSQPQQRPRHEQAGAEPAGSNCQNQVGEKTAVLSPCKWAERREGSDHVVTIVVPGAQIKSV